MKRNWPQNVPFGFRNGLDFCFEKLRVGRRITSEVRWDQSHIIPLLSHQAPKNCFADFLIAGKSPLKAEATHCKMIILSILLLCINLIS